MLARASAPSDHGPSADVAMPNDRNEQRVLELNRFLLRLIRTRAATPPKPKLVWRMSDRSPGGEWVDPNAPPVGGESQIRPDAEPSTGGWITSSMDLLDGMDIVHHDGQIDEVAAFVPWRRPD